MHRLKKILQSKTMAMSSAERVPQEIIVDILTRLPAKSVGQFRCVSKQWCSLLSDPQFIKAHLTIHDHKVGEDKLILAFSCHSFLTVAFNQNPQNGNDVITRKLNFQQLWENWTTVGGSCHGLILVGNEEKIQFLINPTTLEYHEIPTFDMALPVLGSVFLYGLGYDVVSDDYKVVTLSYCKYMPFYTFVDVYSVREGIWRRLENSPYNHEVADLDYGVWLNGALHWLAAKPSDGSPVIVAFDLSVEKFLEVPPPATLDKKDFLLSVFVALRGCLCMSPVRRRNEVDVWMMKDYGVEESWTKFVVKGPETYLIPLCLISEDDVLLDANGELIVYNMREDQWRNRMVDGINTILVHAMAGTFRESLVSPMLG